MAISKAVSMELDKSDIEDILDIELEDAEFQEIIDAWDDCPPYDEVAKVIGEWFSKQFDFTIKRQTTPTFKKKGKKPVKPEPVKKKKSLWQWRK